MRTIKDLGLTLEDFELEESQAVDENAFRIWYGEMARRHDLNPDPDDPRHYYDYRAAYKANAQPDDTGHWPSEYKRDGHPRMIVDGINTKTGGRAQPLTIEDLGFSRDEFELEEPRTPTVFLDAPDEIASRLGERTRYTVERPARVTAEPATVTREADAIGKAKELRGLPISGKTREEVVENLPVVEQQEVSQAMDMLKTSSPGMGAAVQTLGAGLKAITEKPFDPTDERQVATGIRGREVARQYDDIQSRIRYSSHVRDGAGLRESLQKMKAFQSTLTPEDRAAAAFYRRHARQIDNRETGQDKFYRKADKAIRGAGEHLMQVGEVLNPSELQEYNVAERIEALAESDGITASALERGDLGFVIDQMIGDAALADNPEAAKRLMGLKKEFQKVAANQQPDKGALKKLYVSTLEMLPPMVKSGAKLTVPVVGQAWGTYEWARQGAGDVYAEMMEAGVDHETARAIAPAAGLVYAGIEKLQIGQIANIPKKAADQAIKNTVLRIAKEKGADWLQEVSEEGVQKLVTGVAAEIGKRHSGVSKEDLGESLKRMAGDVLAEMGHAAGPMGVLSLIGAGGGIVRHQIEQRREGKNAEAIRGDQAAPATGGDEQEAGSAARGQDIQYGEAAGRGTGARQELQAGGDAPQQRPSGKSSLTDFEIEEPSDFYALNDDEQQRVFPQLSGPEQDRVVAAYVPTEEETAEAEAEIAGRDPSLSIEPDEDGSGEDWRDTRETEFDKTFRRPVYDNKEHLSRIVDWAVNKAEPGDQIVSGTGEDKQVWTVSKKTLASGTENIEFAGDHPSNTFWVEKRPGEDWRILNKDGASTAFAFDPRSEYESDNPRYISQNESATTEKQQPSPIISAMASPSVSPEEVAAKYAEKPRAPREIIDRDYVIEQKHGDDPELVEELKDARKDDLFGDFGVLRKREFEKTQKELESAGVPYTFGVADVVNLGGANTAYKNDHAKANEAFRAVIGEVYAEQVRQYGGVVGRTGGDEFQELWPNYSLEEVEEIRGAIERQVREKVVELGLDETPHPKAQMNNMPTGALYTHYGLTEGVPGQYGEMNRLAEEAADFQKTKEISALSGAREYIYSEETNRYERRSTSSPTGNTARSIADRGDARSVEKQEPPHSEAGKRVSGRTPQQKTAKGQVVASPDVAGKRETFDIEGTRQEVDTLPSEPQKEAGNYKKGHIERDGFRIFVENPAGSRRSGKDKSGKEWSRVMRHHYGYFLGTRGRDKDHVDVFVKPNGRGDGGTVYVVNQVDPGTGKFDEHKVMLGFGNETEARRAYLSNYDKGWRGLGEIVPMTPVEFKRWIQSDTLTRMPAERPWKTYARGVTGIIAKDYSEGGRVVYSDRFNALSDTEKHKAITKEKKAISELIPKIQEGLPYVKPYEAQRLKTLYSRLRRDQKAYSTAREKRLESDEWSTKRYAKNGRPETARFDEVHNQIIDTLKRTKPADMADGILAGKHSAIDVERAYEAIRAKQPGNAAAEIIRRELAGFFMTGSDVGAIEELLYREAERMRGEDGGGAVSIDEMIPAADGEEFLFQREIEEAESYSVFGWPDKWPRSAVLTIIGRLKKDPDYGAAKKQADAEAAGNIAERIIDKGKARYFKERYEFNVVVPVDAEEAGGKNKIPRMLAERIGILCDTDVDSEIVQSNHARHSGAAPLKRLLRRPEFSGAVRRGGKYLIVDDVVTTGSTINELRKHIEKNGGQVVGVVSGAIGRPRDGGSPTLLKPQKETLARANKELPIDEINTILGLYGYEKIEELTDPQIRTLLKSGALDEIRAAGSAAVSEGNPRIRSKEVGEGSGRGSDVGELRPVYGLADAVREMAAGMSHLDNPLEVAEAYGELLRARAEAVGMSPDEYVNTRLRFESENAINSQDLRQGGAARGRIALRRGAPAIISLLRDADASTVGHELGHLFMDDLSIAGGADWKVVQDWLNVASASEIGVAEKERFARAFERWLRDGNAPSKKLAGIFEKFREWLSRVYRAVTEYFKSGDEVSPEIRGVFERLINKSGKSDAGRSEDFGKPSGNVAENFNQISAYHKQEILEQTPSQKTEPEEAYDPEGAFAKLIEDQPSDVQQNYKAAKEKAAAVGRPDWVVSQLSEIERDEKDIKRLTGRYISMLPVDRAIERAAIEVELKEMREGRSEKVRSLIYDYAKKSGIRGVPYNRVDTLLKNAKTAADAQRALKIIDEVIQKRNDEGLRRRVKAIVGREFYRLERGKHRRGISTDPEFNRRLKEYLASLMSTAKDEELEGWMRSINYYLGMGKQDAERKIEAGERVGKETLEWLEDPTRAVPATLRKKINQVFARTLDVMTPTELREVIENIDLLKKQGRLKREIEEHQRIQRNANAAQAIAAEVKRNTKNKPRTNVDKALNGDAPGKTKGNVEKMLLEVLDTERIIKYLTGFAQESVLMSEVWKPLWNATNKYLSAMKKAEADFRRRYGWIDMKKARGDTFMKITVKREEVNEKSGEKTTVSETHDLTLSDMMFVYANSKNSGNRAHLYGTGFTDEQIDMIIENLPSEYKNAIDAEMEYFDKEQYDRLNEIFRIEYGVDMPKEHSYFPIANLDTDRAENAIVVDMLSRMGARHAMVQKGMVKSRVQSYAPYKKFDYFGTLLNNRRMVEHYVAMSQPVRQVNQILNHPNVKEAIKQKSPVAYQKLRQWLDAVAYGKIRTSDHLLDQIFEYSRHGYAMYVLGFKLTSVMMQLGSLPKGLAFVKGGRIMQAAGAFAKNPQAFIERIDGLSPAMENRTTDFEREMAEMSEKDMVQAGKKLGPKQNALRAIRKFGEISFVPMAAFDKLIASLIWDARYREVLNVTGDQQRAIDAADEVIRKTQSGGGLITLPAAMRASGLLRAFSMFKSDPSKTFNLLYELTGEVASGKKQFKDNAYALSMILIVAPVITTIIKNGGRMPWDDPEDFAKELVNNWADGIPLLGQILNAAMVYAGREIRKARGVKADNLAALFASDQNLPPLELFNSIQQGLAQGRALPLIDATAMLAGIPFSQIKRTWKGSKLVQETGDWRYVIWPEYAIGGNTLVESMQSRVKRAKDWRDRLQFVKYWQNKSQIQRTRFVEEMARKERMALGAVWESIDKLLNRAYSEDGYFDKKFQRLDASFEQGEIDLSEYQEKATEIEREWQEYAEAMQNMTGGE